MRGIDIFGLFLFDAEYAWKKEGQRREIYAAHVGIIGDHQSDLCV